MNLSGHSTSDDCAAEYLAACRQFAGASPDGDPHWDPPASDVLDLDWAPALLTRVGELTGLDDVHLDALRQSTNGDTALDVGFLSTHPHAIGPFGPVPAALTTAQVARVSETLTRIDMPVLLAALPSDESDAASALGHGADQITGGPRNYLLKHFTALRDFSRDAAQSHLLVVLWWD